MTHGYHRTVTADHSKRHIVNCARRRATGFEHTKLHKVRARACWLDRGTHRQVKHIGGDLL